MKKHFLILILLAALAWTAPALAEELDEWTVMFYLCGSDLESKNGYATGNLEEIQSCLTYDTAKRVMGRINTNEESLGGVNVVLETGGCKEWHAQTVGMEIDPGSLQRWRFRPDSSLRDDVAPFSLEQTLPLANMADAPTLADFIRWSAENYPAKKYALVLWDHGGGSRTGILVDELFDGDILYLDELQTALRNGGAQLETVLFDACLMANIETACAVSDSARWMIASEEVVAGKGTAMGDWLQQLYYTPQWDGRRLGRWICDMTQVKYSYEKDEQSRETLTWSVIDLSKIDRLANTFDRFFAHVGESYAQDPLMMQDIGFSLYDTFEFGLGDSRMLDLMESFYRPNAVGLMKQELYIDMLDALEEAVVYCVRGSDRGSASGISYCYATDFSTQELDIYARNCPFAHYLAFLDAIHPGWTAPDWVFQQARRLPEITELSDYQIIGQRTVNADGIPGIIFVNGFTNVMEVYGRLYAVSEKTGSTIYLGNALAKVDLSADIDTVPPFILQDFWHWPAVEDVHCCVDLHYVDSMGRTLYNIPVRIGEKTYQLRCGYDEQSEEKLTIYGLWQGYDNDGNMFGRNVAALSQMVGQEFCLLYPIADTEKTGSAFYEASEPMTIFRSLEIKPKTLPPGTYYLEYTVTDVFMRKLSTDRAELYWDGETLTLSAPWEGEAELTLPAE